MPLGHRFAFSSSIMATHPSGLADSSAAVPPIVSSVPPSGTAKFPVFLLFVAVVVGAVISALSVGAVVYYLARTGRFSILEGAAHKVEAVGPGTTHVMALEPLLVNLSGVGGSSYLRVSLTLRVADVSEEKGSKTKEENL